LTVSDAPFLPFGKPIIGQEEKDAVLETLDGPVLVHGPRAKGFEDDFAAWTGAPHAVSVASCTAGMHLIYFALGYGPGDEVIVPAQTHTATAHAVALTGATPVFVDAEPFTGNIDIDKLEAAITPRTRAIAVVHFLGLPVDMTRVMEIARRRGLFVLEDCALAFGTRLDGVHAGLLGDAGVFSFYPVKHMTTAEGGMIVTRDGALADLLRRQRAFGVDRTHGERAAPGSYDVTMLGFNYRMNELEAAIGIVQLRRLDGFLAARKANFAALAAGLEGAPGLTILPDEFERAEGGRYCLQAMLSPELTPRRTDVMLRLKELGVGVSVYYPRPVPLMTWYRERGGHRPEDFPVATRISEASISLPVGPHLTVDDMARIAAAFRSAVKDVAL
jgi:perosamine synthetase